jgi:indole-3-glycerol phosphate synthase
VNQQLFSYKLAMRMRKNVQDCRRVRILLLDFILSDCVVEEFRSTFVGADTMLLMVAE